MQFLSLFSSVHQWSYGKFARWIFFGALFLAIIVLIPTSSVPFLYTKISLLALGGIAAFTSYVFSRLSQGSLVLPPPLLLSALWLIPFAYVLSVLFSGAPVSLSVFGRALDSDTLGFMLLAGSLGTLAALLIRRVKHYRLFFWWGAFLAGTVFSIQLIILIIGYFAPSAVSPTLSIVGPFSDLTIFAGLSTIMTLLTFRLTNPTFYGKRLLCALLALSLLFVALGGSMVTWLLLALVALGLLVERIMRNSSVTKETFFEEDSTKGTFSVETEEVITVSNSSDIRPSFIAPAIALAIALLFIIGGTTISSALGSALHVQTSSVRPSWQSTIAIGRQTYATSAIFGSGPNTFAQQWLTFRNATLNTTQFWNINFESGIGFIPTSFVTTGIIGILAWVIFLGLFIFFGLRALIMREAENSSVRTVAIVTFVGGLYLMLELLFTVPGPMVILLGFILIGVFASVLRYLEPKGELNISFTDRPRIGFVVVFVLMLVMLASLAAAYVIVERYIAEVSLLQARTSLSAGDLNGADASIQRSLAFAPSVSAYQIQTIIGLTHIKKIEQNKKLSADQARASLRTILSQTIASAHEATLLNPQDYQNWYLLGSVYKSIVPVGVSGAYAAAVSAYNKAEKLNPTSPIIPFTLAQLAISNKDYKAAEPLLKQSITLKRNYTPAIFSFSRVEVQLGKAKEALQAAEAAAYFAPNNPTVLFQVGVLRELTGDYKGAVTVLSQAVKINPKYANARYSLAVAYAYTKNYTSALTQIKAVIALSKSNTKALTPILTVLKNNINPFAKSTQKTSLGRTARPTLSGK